MRKTLILLFLFLLTGIFSAEAKKKDADTINVDKLKYRIVYDTKVVTDTTRTPYVYKQGQSHLDIGEKGVTRFYSHTREMRLAAMSEMLKTSGMIDMRVGNMPKDDGVNWEFSLNYPSAGKSTFIDNVGMAYYECVENIETPEWTLVPDSTATIMGYTCQLATTTFKGRVWSAWYTEDIPLDNGPWKLRGLPGLILRAYDGSHQYEFSASGMTNGDGSIPVIYRKHTAENVSQRDLDEIQKKFDPMESFQGVKVYDASGKDITKSPQRKAKRMRFNNLEIYN